LSGWQIVVALSQSLPSLGHPLEILLLRADLAVLLMDAAASLARRRPPRDVELPKREVRPDGTIVERVSSMGDLEAFLASSKGPRRI
jgi:hypothetical protein